MDLVLGTADSRHTLSAPPSPRLSDRRSAPEVDVHLKNPSSRWRDCVHDTYEYLSKSRFHSID